MSRFVSELIGLLERSGRFPGASETALADLAAAGCEIEVDPGRLLAWPQVRMDDLLVIIEGCAVRTVDGERFELGPGSVIGDEPVATVEAVTVMRLAAIPLVRLSQLGWGAR